MADEDEDEVLCLGFIKKGVEIMLKGIKFAISRYTNSIFCRYPENWMAKTELILNFFQNSLLE